MQMPRQHTSNTGTCQTEAEHLTALMIAKSLQDTVPHIWLQQSVHDVEA